MCCCLESVSLLQRPEGDLSPVGERSEFDHVCVLPALQQPVQRQRELPQDHCADNLHQQ